MQKHSDFPISPVSVVLSKKDALCLLGYARENFKQKDDVPVNKLVNQASFSLGKLLQHTLQECDQNALMKEKLQPLVIQFKEVKNVPAMIYQAREYGVDIVENHKDMCINSNFSDTGMNYFRESQKAFECSIQNDRQSSTRKLGGVLGIIDTVVTGMKMRAEKATVA